MRRSSVTVLRRGSARNAVYALLVLAGVAALLILFGGRLRQAPETTYRGTLTMRGGSGQFTVCGESAPTRVTDASRALARIYGEVAGAEGQSVFAEVRGSRRGDHLAVTQLRRMELESRGCGEDLSGVEFRAFGNEPFWRMDVGPRQIVLTRPGSDPVTFSALRRTNADGNRIYTGDAEGHRLELTLSEQPCRDSMAGSYYSYAASARVDGQSYEGCAKEGRP